MLQTQNDKQQDRSS